MSSKGAKGSSIKQAAAGSSYQRLYSEEPGGGGGRAEVKKFLERLVPPSDVKEIEDELKKTVPISGPHLRGKRKRFFKKGGGDRIEPVRRRQGKLLTARERRGLGLHKVPKKGLKYDDLLKINELWLKYISELVDWSKWKPGEGDGYQVRLCRADYHGAKVKVTKSPNRELVGTEGIVAVETRNTFRILGTDNVLRTVPKKGNSFTFRAGEEHVFTVGGSSMLMKPSERAVKKWKTKGPLDL